MNLDEAALPANPLQPSIWRSVWKLFRLRWVLFYTGFARAKRRKKVGMIFIFALILLALAGILALSIGALSLLRSPELSKYVDPAPLLKVVPVLILTSAFAGLLITSFGVLLQALYLANDMDFLLASPIPMRAVFITKLVQAVLPNFGLISLFGLPILIGMGISSGFNILYYLFVLIILVTVALAAAGLSSLLVMGIVRIFPARRVAEILAFFGAIISFFCSQTGQFTRGMNISSGQTSQALTTLSRLDTPWSPLAWAGRGLLDIAEGRWLSGLGLMLLSIGLGLGIFYLALVTAERLYYSGWARIQINVRKKRPARGTTAAAPVASRQANPVSALFLRIPAPTRGIVRKDWLMLRRDLRNMSQLVTPLLFGVIYSVVFFRRGLMPGNVPADLPFRLSIALRNFLIYANIGLSLFVGWTLQSRLAMMGFSQEGKSYWLLKTSPLTNGRLVLAKFIVAYLPTLLIGWFFLVLITLIQGADLAILGFGIFVVAFCIAGAVGINLAFGITSANLTWEDPRRMTRGTTGCVASLVSFAYLLFSLVIFFGPPVLFSLFSLPEDLGRLLGLVIGGAFSLACAVIPPRLVLNRVARIGED